MHREIDEEAETKKKPGTKAGTEPLRASFREVKRGGFKPKVNLSQSIRTSRTQICCQETEFAAKL